MDFTCTIKIKVANSTFDDRAGYEILRLIQDGIRKEHLNITTIEKGDSPFKDTEPLHDSNGNRVGAIEIKVTK